MWRSWLAYTHGVRVVAGSSPATPTKIKPNPNTMLTKLKKAVLLFLIGLFLMPSLAFADGMVIGPPDPYSRNQFDFIKESSQQAYINHEDGLEKLIISIGLEETAEGAVWIFPVPADPSKVVIDILTTLPHWRGRNIAQKAKSELTEINRFLRDTQLYPLLFEDFLWDRAGIESADSIGISPTVLTTTKRTEPEVVVHEHLEKEGITTEVLTAKTGQDLYRYLGNKNLEVEEGSIPVLDNYVGRDFTFVASWLGEKTFHPYERKSQEKGIFITFPTKKIYYPLLPTSVYGSEVIPTSIRILGLVKPKIFRDIKPYTETSHFKLTTDPNSSIPHFTKKRFRRDAFEYTVINLNAPSKMLTQDLWISSLPPVKPLIGLFIVNHPVISAILLLILTSFITSIFISLIIFREARRKKGLIKFSLIGLSNCLSIIGFTIVTILASTKDIIKPEDQKLFAELKKRGYSSHAVRATDWRKLIFVPAFSIGFLIIAWLTTHAIIWIL